MFVFVRRPTVCVLGARGFWLIRNCLSEAVALTLIGSRDREHDQTSLLSSLSVCTQCISVPRAEDGIIQREKKMAGDEGTNGRTDGWILTWDAVRKGGGWRFLLLFQRDAARSWQLSRAMIGMHDTTHRSASPLSPHCIRTSTVAEWRGVLYAGSSNNTTLVFLFLFWRMIVSTLLRCHCCANSSLLSRYYFEKPGELNRIKNHRGEINKWSKQI